MMQSNLNSDRRDFLKAAGTAIAALGAWRPPDLPLLLQRPATFRICPTARTTSTRATGSTSRGSRSRTSMGCAWRQSLRPEDAGPQRRRSGAGRRPPDGRGEGAKRQPVRHEDGRAGLRHPVPGSVVLGRKRRPAPQRGRRRTSTPRISAPPSISWAPGHRRPERIGAIGICGSGSFVISAAKIDPRMKAIATVSMYDMGAANRNGLKKSQTLEQRKQTIAEAARAARTWSSRAARPNTPAGQCTR